MTDKKYQNKIELIYVGNGFIPGNENAHNLIEQCGNGDVVSFLEITSRDLKRHKGYMALLKTIYNYLPKKFQDEVPCKYFYQYLKHLQNKYKVIIEFKDGTKLVEYESISFGKMSEKRFREYIKEQLPYIYKNVIGDHFEGEIYDNIIFNIEQEFEKFLSKL